MNVLNINEREIICKKCPIFNPINSTCNPKLWINPETDEVSTSSKSGFIRGCGCHVLMKMKSLSAHCVAKKW